jgi:hypothetical protein
LAAAAIEQQDVQGIFDLPNSVREGTGNQAKFSGSGGKAACLLDGQQHAEGIGGEEVTGVSGHV